VDAYRCGVPLRLRVQHERGQRHCRATDPDAVYARFGDTQREPIRHSERDAHTDREWRSERHPHTDWKWYAERHCVTDSIADRIIGPDREPDRDPEPNRDPDPDADDESHANANLHAHANRDAHACGSAVGFAQPAEYRRARRGGRTPRDRSRKRL